MAVTGWPTEAAEGQVATELRWRKMARLWAPEGVAAGVLNEMAVSLAAGQITVATGAVWLDGHYAENDSALVVPVTSDGQLVLRYTYVGSVFAIVFVAGQTTPVRNATQYEIALALMTAGVMTDQRLLVSPNSDVARVVFGSAVNTASITLATGFQSIVGITPAIPAHWGSYSLQAEFWSSLFNLTANDDVEYRFNIGGALATISDNGGTTRTLIAYQEMPAQALPVVPVSTQMRNLTAARGVASTSGVRYTAYRVT